MNERGSVEGITRVATATLPTRWADFSAVAYRTEGDGQEHLALVLNNGESANAEPADGDARAPLVRLHSECLTGDVFGSGRCDCGEQLQLALAAIAKEGGGAVLYLRGHEGRGIGLAAKIAAYHLQDQGYDTVDANLALGLPVDARDYRAAAAMLRDLGMGSVRLLTNNPAKGRGLALAGIEVAEFVALQTTASVHNARYLRTKQQRMGHRLGGDQPLLPLPASPGQDNTSAPARSATRSAE